MEIGSALIHLEENNVKLHNEIRNARKNLYFPLIRIIDNPSFEPNEYRLFAFGIIVAKGAVNEEYTSEEKISQIIYTIVNYFQGNNEDPWHGN